ncbi:hypothetical protein QVD17_13333 [Tagetes erecta]|uniref:Uncharacterized protein n=1 Tax=Tagetes erecta TaxID=13708 RepID=A0AAD8L3B0_TARER|nr:hypothetical protein QVD17_13333 [Tagetes erecta]
MTINTYGKNNKFNCGSQTIHKETSNREHDDLWMSLKREARSALRLNFYKSKKSIDDKTKCGMRHNHTFFPLQTLLVGNSKPMRGGQAPLHHVVLLLEYKYGPCIGKKR